jgi:hypothetical protein
MFKRLARSVMYACLLVAATSASASADTPTPGDIPDNQAFVEFRQAQYAVKTPEGWARSSTRGVLTFSDKYNALSITGTRAPRPTIPSVRQHELATLKAARPGFRSPSVSMVRRPAGVAVLIRFRALSRRDAVTGRRVLDAVERYEFWRAGTLVALSLEAPVGSDNVDPWRIITTSFRWR